MITSITDATKQHWDNNQSYCTTELDAPSNSYSKHLGFTSIQERIKERKVWLVKTKDNTKNVIYVRYFLKYEQEVLHKCQK